MCVWCVVTAIILSASIRCSIDNTLTIKCKTNQTFHQSHISHTFNKSHIVIPVASIWIQSSSFFDQSSLRSRKWAFSRCAGSCDWSNENEIRSFLHLVSLILIMILQYFTHIKICPLKSQLSSADSSVVRESWDHKVGIVRVFPVNVKDNPILWLDSENLKSKRFLVLSDVLADLFAFPHLCQFYGLCYVVHSWDFA